MSRKEPLTLVPDTVSHETKACLRRLCAEAARGELIGIAYAALYRGRSFIVNSAGEVHNSPTLARGMLAALDDQFSRMIWEHIL